MAVLRAIEQAFRDTVSAVGCGQRVAVWHGGRVFACRPFNRLTYRSQREADDYRATRRADTIRPRLDWWPGILNGNGLKPKGMHGSTLERLPGSTASGLWGDVFD